MKILLILTCTIILLLSCSKEPESFRDLLSAGQNAFVNQNYPLACNYLGKAISINPSDKTALYFLGMSYSRDFIYDSAFVYLKRADLYYPDDREINATLYDVALALEEWQTAIKAIYVLTKTGDKIESYYQELAKLHIRKQDYGHAFRYIRLQLDQEPENKNLYLKLGMLAAQINQLELAVALLDTAIEKFGEAPEFATNKATYLAGLKEYLEAEKILRGLILKDPSSAALKLNLAGCLSSQDSKNKKREAYDLYRELAADSTGAIQTGDDLDSIITSLAEELDL